MSGVEVPFSLDRCRQAILDYMTKPRAEPLKRRALARALDIAPEYEHEFRRAVQELLDEGVMTLGRGRTLTAGRAAETVVGVLHLDARGFGFIDRQQLPSVYIPRGKTGGAVHGDTVEVRLASARRLDRRPSGRVTRILRTTDLRWVGVLDGRGGRWFVHPQGAPSPPVIEVDDPTAKSACAGDLVVVEPIRPVAGAGAVRGVIVERLGPSSESEVRILGVMRRFGIPDAFAAEVRREAQAATGRLTKKVIAERTDLRDLLTITIDPSDARDFDDAISVEPLADGQVELGVHIADVSFFVPPGGALDEEARARGTSTYFPGRVSPMLPETLSNGVCSLQEGQPRLTRSVFLRYDARGGIRGARFCQSVIQSRRRLTYERVEELLAQRDAGADPVVELLHRAARLARVIRARRIAAGMIVLNVPEVAIELDAQGRVVGAGPAHSGFSHTMIEMFMVEANEAVSGGLNRLNVPHLRRVHPPPDEEAAAQLQRRLAAVDCAPPRSMDRRALQKLLESVRDKPEEVPINLLLLRCLSQAVYGPQRVGHFALASEDYCHFTSPIRRYPDLTVHRLFDLLVHRRSARGAARRLPYTREQLLDLGKQCSTLERRAQDAEREAKSILLMQFMSSKVGEEFDGVVTGVSAAGVFVRIQPFMAEGLIRLSELGGDRWRFSRAAGTLGDSRSGRVIGIGQPLRVRVAEVDQARGQMVLVPAQRTPGRARPTVPTRRRGRERTGTARPRRPRPG